MRKLEISAMVVLLLATGCSPASENEVVPPASTPAVAGSGLGGGGVAPASGTAGAARGGTPPLDIDVSAGGSSSEPIDGESRCAVAALGNPGRNASTSFAQWLSARGPKVDRFGAGAPLLGLTVETLTSYQVVLLDWLPRDTQLGMTPAELAGWVGAGGRIIALSGYADDAGDPDVSNSLLAPLSLGFDASGGGTRSGTLVTFGDHPITAGLAARADFSGIPFTGGWPILYGPADELLMTLNGSVVAVAAERGRGRAFVFGDEWLTFDSEWSKIPEIERLWFNVFAWLGECALSPPSVN